RDQIAVVGLAGDNALAIAEQAARAAEQAAAGFSRAEIETRRGIRAGVARSERAALREDVALNRVERGIAAAGDVRGRRLLGAGLDATRDQEDDHATAHGSACKCPAKARAAGSIPASPTVPAIVPVRLPSAAWPANRRARSGRRGSAHPRPPR